MWYGVNYNLTTRRKKKTEYVFIYSYTQKHSMKWWPWKVAGVGIWIEVRTDFRLRKSAKRDEIVVIADVWWWWLCKLTVLNRFPLPLTLLTRFLSFFHVWSSVWHEADKQHSINRHLNLCFRWDSEGQTICAYRAMCPYCVLKWLSKSK